MIQTDEFDVLLMIRPHGWSDFFLLVNYERFEYSISHVFSSPFFDIINVLSDLIKQQKETSFIWYGEPGGVKFELQRIISEQNKIVVSVHEFRESHGYEPKYDSVIEFEIKIKQLVTVLYCQLKKNFMLLNDRQFANNRDGYDLKDFHNFEKSIIEFLNR